MMADEPLMLVPRYLVDAVRNVVHLNGDSYEHSRDRLVDAWMRYLSWAAHGPHNPQLPALLQRQLGQISRELEGCRNSLGILSDLLKASPAQTAPPGGGQND